jgi:DNA end-binding protein Ku
LVEDRSGKWNPDDFKDEFKHAVMKIVDKKVKAGDTEAVLQPEEDALGIRSDHRSDRAPRA